MKLREQARQAAAAFLTGIACGAVAFAANGRADSAIPFVLVIAIIGGLLASVSD